MNRTAIPATRAPLSLLTAEHGQTRPHQTPDAGFTAEFQELCSLAMDRALGFEKASLDAVVQMQSCAIDVLESASWASPLVSPALGDLIDLAVQAITLCLELQLNWLAVMTPVEIEKTETSLRVVLPARKPVGSVRTLSHSTGDGLDHSVSMDIAIGERAA